MFKPYDRLASVYDGGWFEYSQYIATLVEEIEHERGRPFRRVCDAACGTGLFLRLLGGDDGDAAAAGANRRVLAGFDRSSAMLERARERLPEARLALGDLAGVFPFNGPFDLITCVYDSINYLLDYPEVLQFLRSARARLFPDGMLLVDFNTAAMYRERDGMEQPHLIGGVVFRETLSFSPGPPPLVTTRFHFSDGVEEHHQRPWEVDQMEELLRESGFRVLDTFDVMDRESGDESGDGAESGKVVCTAVP